MSILLHHNLNLLIRQRSAGDVDRIDAKSVHICPEEQGLTGVVEDARGERRFVDVDPFQVGIVDQLSRRHVDGGLVFSLQ